MSRDDCHHFCTGLPEETCCLIGAGHLSVESFLLTFIEGMFGCLILGIQ